MIHFNKSLDSKVSCLGIEGIYILYLAFIALGVLALVFICMLNGVPLFATIVIVMAMTGLAVYKVFTASKKGNAITKLQAKRKMNYYIIKR